MKRLMCILLTSLFFNSVAVFSTNNFTSVPTIVTDVFRVDISQCPFNINSNEVILVVSQHTFANPLMVNWSWLRSILSSLNESGGFFAGLALYILIPLCLAFLLIFIPAKLFAKVRFLNNFFYTIIAFPAGFIMAINISIDLCKNAAFRNNLGEPWIFIYMIVLSFCMVWGVWKQRCPKCRSMKFHLADEYSETRSWKEKEIYSLNSQKIGESKPRNRSKTTRHNLRKCNECGNEWWVSF